MIRALLVRGMLVGLLAGLVTFAFAKVYGEPPIEQAIAFEAHEQEHEHPNAQHDEQELVSRSTQAGLGLLTAITVYGAAIGGFFALVFAYWNGRIDGVGPRGTAAIMASLGFVTLALVPHLIYPANPPSVGHADTIGARTALFFGTVLISITALGLSVALTRRARAKLGRWNAVLAGVLLYVLVMGVAQAILPGINEVPDEFSAVLLWHFRVASFGTQLILWTTLGLVFGAIADRFLRAQHRL